VLRTSMKMAAAALAAGAVLTACGPIKMGAAAVMTSQRISTSTLAAEVSNLNQGYLKYKGKITLQYPVSQMPQQVLGWLVRFRVRDQLAAALQFFGECHKIDGPLRFAQYDHLRKNMPVMGQKKIFGLQ